MEHIALQSRLALRCSAIRKFILPHQNVPSETFTNVKRKYVEKMENITKTCRNFLNNLFTFSKECVIMDLPSN